MATKMTHLARQIDKKELERALAPLFTKPCCRQRIGSSRSLSMGFGNKVTHGNARLPDPFYGEWEIGTYYGSWRITQQNEIVLGNRDVVDSEEEMNLRFRAVNLGKIIGISSVSRYDVRVAFSGDLALDILDTSSDDDELFHVFGPDGLFVEYSSRHGWKLGKSNAPWT